MILHRPWIAMIVASCLCSRAALAQVDGGASSNGPSSPAAGSSGTGTGSSGSSGTGGSTAPESSGFGSTPGASSSFGSGSGASSSFGTPAPVIPEPIPGATSGGQSTTGSQSSLQGTGFQTPKVPTAAAPSFSLPGFYGASATSLTAGEGRLARPRFRYNVSMSLGYDDNTQQTPTNTPSFPAVYQEVIVDPGTPPTIQQVPVRGPATTQIGPGGLIITRPGQIIGFTNQIIPGTAPKTQRVLVQPAIPKQERDGSVVTRANGGIDIQLFSARSLFTFDLNGGADYNWSRPTRSRIDYNGALVFSFLYRLTPRLQFTTQFNGAYLTQPDLSRINTPQNQTGSAYINTNAKIDLSYRVSPRFTTVLSLSDNALYFQEKLQQNGDYSEVVGGAEFRYLFSPRMTLLLEGRYNSTTYAQDSTRDSTSAFLLVGAEVQLSRVLSGSVRIGESIRTFTESGISNSSPYLEANVAYRIGPTSVVNANTRFGFEEPATAGQTRLVYRFGLSYSQAFSPRLSGSVGINYLHDTVSGQNMQDDITSTYDANFQLNYLVTRQFSLNANYSFTTLISEQGFRDYYRNRFFFGGAYTF